MSVDNNAIMSLKVEDITSKLINDLQLLAIQAERETELLKATHLFRIGETKVEFSLQNGSVKATLTSEGCWHAKCQDWDISIEIHANGIFELYKADKLVREKMVDKIDKKNGKLTEAGTKSEASEAFKEFLKKCL